MTGMLAFSSGPSCQRSGRWLACWPCLRRLRNFAVPGFMRRIHLLAKFWKSFLAFPIHELWVKCYILELLLMFVLVQMLNEFCSLTGAEECKFKENWGKYEKLVFKYAPLEQKKSVKILLLGQCDNAGRCIYTFVHTYLRCTWCFASYIFIILLRILRHTDRTAAYTLDLLSALLSTNRSSGQPLVSIFEVCVILSRHVIYLTYW